MLTRPVDHLSVVFVQVIREESCIAELSDDGV